MGEIQTGVMVSWFPPFVVKIVRAAAGFPFNTEDVQILNRNHAFIIWVLTCFTYIYSMYFLLCISNIMLLIMHYLQAICKMIAETLSECMVTIRLNV